MKLIDADELKNTVAAELDVGYTPLTPTEEWKTLEKTIGVVLEIIDECPEINPVKHAHWVPSYDYVEYGLDGTTKLSKPTKFQDGWKCSNCSHYEFSNSDSFCGGCGAIMDEEENK